MEEEHALYEVEGKVGIITMNRPDKLNALGPDLKAALVAAFAKADSDPATSVVVLRSNGRSFCAGYDLSGDEGPEDTTDALSWHANLAPGVAMEMTPWYMSKPVICSVQGHALGGGCELTMFCDLTIAADNALFGEPESRFGKTGPAFIMPWLVGYKKARELIYFGDMITSNEALALGMINKIVPVAELREATMKYADRLALIEPEVLRMTKLAINRGADVAGFRNAIMAGLDAITPLYAAETELGREFGARIQKDGLPAALRWRRDQFAE
jgi:enoyl-CoA hydratase/carnithine racemase